MESEVHRPTNQPTNQTHRDSWPERQLLSTTGNCCTTQSLCLQNAEVAIPSKKDTTPTEVRQIIGKKWNLYIVYKQQSAMALVESFHCSEWCERERTKKIAINKVDARVAWERNWMMPMAPLKQLQAAQCLAECCLPSPSSWVLEVQCAANYRRLDNGCKMYSPKYCWKW